MSLANLAVLRPIMSCITNSWNSSWKNRGDGFALKAVTTLASGKYGFQTGLLSTGVVALKAMDVYGLSGQPKLTGQDFLINLLKKKADKVLIGAGMTLTAYVVWHSFGKAGRSQDGKTPGNSVSNVVVPTDSKGNVYPENPLLPSIEPSTSTVNRSMSLMEMSPGEDKPLLFTLSDPEEMLSQLFKVAIAPVTGLLKGSNNYFDKAYQKAADVYDENRLSWWLDIKETAFDFKKYFNPLDQAKYSSFIEEASGNVDVNLDKRLQNNFFLALRVARVGIMALYELKNFNDALAIGKDSKNSVIAKYFARTVLNLGQEFAVGSLAPKFSVMATDLTSLPNESPQSKVKRKKELESSIFGAFSEAILEGSFNYLRNVSTLDDMLA
jgi:hypothetical protein